MRILDPLADPHWDEKLLAHEEASIFHTAAWARVLGDTYGLRTCYLGEVEENRFKILLPLMDVRSYLTGRRGVSLPFSDYCEPLIPDGCPGAELLDMLSRIGQERGWRFVDFHGGERLFPSAHPAASYFIQTLELSPDQNVLFMKLKNSTRRNVRKANTAGVAVAVATSMEALKAFYGLHCLTRKDSGLPPQPFAFFRKIHEHIIAKGRGCVALATVRNQTVAGAVFFHFGSRALFKFGASDRRAFMHRPNDSTMWEAIRWHGEKGFSQLCFGRTDRSNEGLRRYKAGFGATERTINYYRYDPVRTAFASIKSSHGNFQRRVFRLLPVFLTQLIGRIAYKHAA